MAAWLPNLSCVSKESMSSHLVSSPRLKLASTPLQGREVLCTDTPTSSAKISLGMFDRSHYHPLFGLCTMIEFVLVSKAESYEYISSPL